MTDQSNTSRIGAMRETIAALERDRNPTDNAAAAQPNVNRQTLVLDAALAEALESETSGWNEAAGTERLWNADGSLWTGGDEACWLGWLELVTEFLSDGGTSQLTELATDLEHEFGASEQAAVVLLGMGGSSLGPEVLSQLLARQRPLHVLDTTDPGQIARVEATLQLENTLFVVSSKSGGTLETNLLFDYFYAAVCEALTPEVAGRHFVVITDPDSSLARLAGERGVDRKFWGKPSVGGRYSVLSNFGLVPAAAIGADPVRLMNVALPMVEACTRTPARVNPAVQLGLLLANAAGAGRDKVTLVADEELAAFGSWVEQLVAESTGHGGKGLIPVDGEESLAPGHYGNDRLFVVLRLVREESEGEVSADTSDQRVAALQEAGHPVVLIEMSSEYHIAQEFFRWQFATAVAGSRLGVNPFVQPDVEAAKVIVRRLTDEFEANGALPEEEPFVQGNRADLYADQTNREALRRPGDESVAEVIAAHLGRVQAGDYVAILAFMDHSAELEELLQAMRGKIAQHRGVATCLGFGPRFLHSTGQVHKGGPNTGVFLQLTHEDEKGLDIPGRGYSFGVAKAAQARGDFEVLVERERRLLRIHFTGKLIAGLQRIDGLIGRALSNLEEFDSDAESEIEGGDG